MEEEEEGAEERTERLVPAEDREVEVSVREGVMEKECVEENEKCKEKWRGCERQSHVQNTQRGDE